MVENRGNWHRFASGSADEETHYAACDNPQPGTKDTFATRSQRKDLQAEKRDRVRERE